MCWRPNFMSNYPVKAPSSALCLKSKREENTEYPSRSLLRNCEIFANLLVHMRNAGTPSTSRGATIWTSYENMTVTKTAMK